MKYYYNSVIIVNKIIKPIKGNTLARFINPVPEYLPNSKLFFKKSGTNTQLVTYADQEENIPNPDPVLCDAAGNTPNVFFSSLAKLIVLDENNVQYIERDPVGGEKELGDFTLWDSVVIYDKNDIVEGSDGGFYISLGNGNQGNDPIIDDGSNWIKINLLEYYSDNKNYSFGDLVRLADGDLYKSLTNNNIGNEPSIDSGVNWLPAINGSKLPEIISLENFNTWSNPETADFAAIARKSYQIDGSASTVDITLPALVIGDSFVLHNLITSTNKVQILNPDYTIKGNGGDILAGTDIELEPGDSVQLIAKTTLILSIVGAQT